ncbi:hypothetical protein Pcinc_017183 [Petrolisthes cinctipes]|uniref:Uncharacterized protein n=1 Tax=Petrolisthes cinctipes TaxID=88211 RepID=A0AAE1FPM4_PETCI|nr:hypothetical protein Pcinc_017183 [Petrolisthes cinctipes]
MEEGTGGAGGRRKGQEELGDGGRDRRSWGTEEGTGGAGGWRKGQEELGDGGRDRRSWGTEDGGCRRIEEEEEGEGHMRGGKRMYDG